MPLSDSAVTELVLERVRQGLQVLIAGAASPVAEGRSKSSREGAHVWLASSPTPPWVPWALDGQDEQEQQVDPDQPTAALAAAA
jgi:hypothetical protein